jgi:hypothetical protein
MAIRQVQQNRPYRLIKNEQLELKLFLQLIVNYANQRAVIGKGIFG